jgi:2-methylcitrate dehydratase PrpD
MTVEPGGLQAIIHHQPTTGLQGKFSAEYVLSACLLDGRVSLATFTDEAVRRAQAQDLLRRVTIVEAATPPSGAPAFEHAYAVVEVTLADGRIVQERCDVPRGDARAPLRLDELEAKFRDCLDFSKTEWDARSLLEGLHELKSAARVGEAIRLAASKPSLVGVR